MATTHDNEETQMQYDAAFSRAARELTELVKSKRGGAQTIQELSDGKDYAEENLDDFDRAPQGVRNKRLVNERWAGIQALLAEDEAESDAVKQELRDLHELLVSGRRSRIRFPGAKGDSTLEPFDREAYVEDDDIDEGFPAGQDRIRERNGSIRAALGGDSMAWRAQASRRGVGEDSYVSGKSLRRVLDPRCFVKGSLQFNLLKSKVQNAISDEQADPELGMILDSYNPLLPSTRYNVVRALANIPANVRRRYGIPDAPLAMEQAFRGVRGSGQGMGCGY